jgi:hypothetical protein
MDPVNAQRGAIPFLPMHPPRLSQVRQRDVVYNTKPSTTERHLDRIPSQQDSVLTRLLEGISTSVPGLGIASSLHAP